MRDNAGIEDFKHATQSYYEKYVARTIREKAQRAASLKPEERDVFFFLIIMPDNCRQEYFYTAMKNKINSDNPVISQFVSSKTINRDNDRIFINIVR